MSADALTVDFKMPRGFIAMAEATFPEGQAFDSTLLRAAQEMQRLTDLRWAAAVSGAMRWGWSQEAAIRRTCCGIDYI